MVAINTKRSNKQCGCGEQGKKKKGKKKSKEELEAERKAREEEEERIRQEELRRQEEEAKRLAEEKRIREEKERKRRAAELASLLAEHEADLEVEAETKAKLQTIIDAQLKKEEWDAYVACSHRPDPRKETDLNTYLSEQAEVDEPKLDAAMTIAETTNEVWLSKWFPAIQCPGLLLFFQRF